MRKVYLCGGIFGLPDKGQTWREQAIGMMPEGWEAVNPVLFELAEKDPEVLIKEDYRLIMNSDAIIARVRNPSWGTAMELHFARQVDIPVIGWPFVRLPPDTHNYSPWLLAHITTYAPSLEYAIGELRHVGVYHRQLADLPGGI